MKNQPCLFIPYQSIRTNSFYFSPFNFIRLATGDQPERAKAKQVKAKKKEGKNNLVQQCSTEYEITSIVTHIFTHFFFCFTFFPLWNDKERDKLDSKMLNEITVQLICILLASWALVIATE